MDSSLKYSNDLYVTTTISSKEVEVRRGEVYRFSSGLQTLAAGVSNGVARDGGVLSTDFVFYLRPSTRYTLKVLAIGAAKITVNAAIIYEQL